MTDQPAPEARTPAPRTQAGRAHFEHHNLMEIWHPVDGRRDEALRDILAIEAEAQFLRPRWHHDRSLPPEDSHFCEDCDEQLAEIARLRAAAGVRVAEAHALREGVRLVDATWRDDYPITGKFNHRHADGTTVAHEPDDYCPDLRLAALAPQPQPESGSAGTSGALREAAQGIVDMVDGWGHMLHRDSTFAEKVDRLRAALAAAPAEPKP